MTLTHEQEQKIKLANMVLQTLDIHGPIYDEETANNIYQEAVSLNLIDEEDE